MITTTPSLDPRRDLRRTCDTCSSPNSRIWDVSDTWLPARPASSAIHRQASRRRARCLLLLLLTRMLPILGSGKFVTPWLRKHSENASTLNACDKAPGLWPDEPQATFPGATARLRAPLLRREQNASAPADWPRLSPVRETPAMLLTGRLMRGQQLAGPRQEQPPALPQPDSSAGEGLARDSIGSLRRVVGPESRCLQRFSKHCDECDDLQAEIEVVASGAKGRCRWRDRSRSNPPASEVRGRVLCDQGALRPDDAYGDLCAGAARP
jgi:hypothetical protein